jgi:uncharacterized membrane protein YkoI
MRKLAVAALFAGLVGIVAVDTAAQAQSIIVGPGGVRVRPDEPPPPYYRDGPRRDRFDRDDRISRREAEHIARRRGMDDVRDIDRDRDRYIVRGEDRRGSRMRVVIDAYSGRVLETVRRD